MYIDIKFKHLQKLVNKRNHAVKEGLLIKEADDFVPASIRIDGRIVNVKFRLKGDHVYHINTDRWSLRVETKNGNQLFGMRHFSLHHPKIRTFQNESLYFETLRYYDVLAPRSLYVNVIVNGDEKGIMQIEEHFSKELIEHQKRRESVIVKFNEDYVLQTKFDPTYDNYKNAYIDAFQSSKVQKTPSLNQQYGTAVGLLRGFAHGYLKPSEVFDVQRLGAYLAVTQLWGVGHASSWRNIRFYLNPITLRMEPIGFDSEISFRTGPGVITFTHNAMPFDMLSDPLIEQAYRETVTKLTKDIQDGSLIQHLRKFELPILKDLYNEFVFLDPFDLGDLKKRIEQIPIPKAKESTGPMKPIYDIDYVKKAPEARFPKVLHLYSIATDGRYYLDLASMIPYDLDLIKIQWIDTQLGTSFEFTPDSTINYPIRLPATATGSTPQSTMIPYTPLGLPNIQLEVTAVLPGTTFKVAEMAVPYAKPLTLPPLPQSTLLTTSDMPAYLSVNIQDRVVTVKKGQWKIHSSLVMPESFRLVVPAGTTLQFGEDAGLFVQGPLLCEGTIDEPIVMEGLSDMDQNGRWMGIFVSEAAAPSIWRHVHIRATNGIAYNGWSLTGGVNFYRSNITMQNCVFEGHQGEDALNIVHADYLLDSVQMSNMKSDGFDSDFSNGTIVNCVFEDIGYAGGGDALDFSGSIVKIDRTRFKNITDKAVSIGEASHAIASNLIIESAGTGIACKDNSQLEIDQASFKDIQTAAIMAYIKKPEYGPGRVTAQHINIEDGLLALVQSGSHVVIDGHVVQTVAMDVDAMYKTNMKREK